MRLPGVVDTEAIPPAEIPSLEGLHRSVPVPPPGAGFWRHWRAFVGPAFLVSVGYMDPGNWGTDIEAGVRFKYGLLWVVAAVQLDGDRSSGAVGPPGRRHRPGPGPGLPRLLPPWSRWPNWLACEVAIAACDLAEVLGSAVAINLLSHGTIPLFWAVIITAFDVLLLLALQGLGMRVIEAVVLTLVITIGACYFIELFVLPPTRPDFAEMGRALISPTLREEGMVVLAIGIIGATVMPHNLYLHSALVQTRRHGFSARASVDRAIRFNTIDTVIALTGRFWSTPRSWCWRRPCFTAGTRWSRAIRREIRRRRRRSGTRLDPSGLFDARPVVRHGGRPARSSRWRCWPAGRAARSLARSPARW